MAHGLHRPLGIGSNFHQNERVFGSAETCVENYVFSKVTETRYLGWIEGSLGPHERSNFSQNTETIVFGEVLG